jgi:hypothetical protein
MLAQTFNHPLKSPNNLHRSTQAASCSWAALPSASTPVHLAFLQAHRPRRSNPHRRDAPPTSPIPRFPPLEVFRRRPRNMSPRHHGPASENLHISGLPRRNKLARKNSGLHDRVRAHPSHSRSREDRQGQRGAPALCPKDAQTDAIVICGQKSSARSQHFRRAFLPV